MLRTSIGSNLISFLPVRLNLLLVLTAASMACAQTHWVGSWGASQQLPEPNNALPADDLRDATLRQVVHLSVGGPQLRVRLSNRFGTAPLHFTAVHVAQKGADKALAFDGRPDVTIPAGADYLSAPLDYPVAALSDLTITLHIDEPPSAQTGHPGSRATSWITHGDFVSAADLPNAKKVEHWYFIAGVDVAASAGAASIVTLGDSITDGHGATTDGNDRWPDALARRLQASPATQSIGVLNHGIGGNRVLLDGLGPNALARFDHDVLGQAGVRYLIILEGVNDIGALGRTGDAAHEAHETLVRNILGAYEQMIARAHTHGIEVIGATIMPFTGSGYYHPGAETEADRQTINQWIRMAGHFDAVVDFDKLMRDPEHPERLLPGYDCGDHLHPSPAGYAAMAEAVSLSLFDSSPRIAITFDDLPVHGPLPPGVAPEQVASKVIAALRDAHLPPTYGFVNGQSVERQPADVEVLKAWRAAGFPLGNHGWSHMNANQHSLAEFETEVAKNEPLLSREMPDGDWHWLRFPYLAEGDTPEKKAGIRAFLRERGYRVAGVTMDFGDYRWNGAYARCRAKGNDKAIALLESSYLAAAKENIDFSRSMSHALYNRDIPYVLLMHIGAFDAEMLPRLLDLYRARGFEFVTLPEAESDEFYRVDTDLTQPPGPDNLEGTMAERHLPLPPRSNPAAQLDSLCR
jgi:lysophospholipase L1-like esterase